MKNVVTRERRMRRSRGKIAELGAVRLSVHRTPKHIYAQVFSPAGSEVWAQASSVEPTLKQQNIGPGKKSVAEAVGKLVAERARAKGVTEVAFDRSGYMYHGRIKALADAARAKGLKF
jgi:large subunit ribosomal protein L18